MVRILVSTITATHNRHVAGMAIDTGETIRPAPPRSSSPSVLKSQATTALLTVTRMHGTRPLSLQLSGARAAV